MSKSQAKEYQLIVGDQLCHIVRWFHRREKPYDKGTTFTRDELKEIKPVNVHDWLAI